jgi:hypothetical protein
MSLLFLHKVTGVRNPIYRFIFHIVMSFLFLHKVTGVRKNKPYLPLWRSGPYAILLALHKESQKPNYPGNDHVCTGVQIYY